MNAKDEETYRQAWEHHIDELAMLALRANVDYTEYVEIKTTLNRWLTKALERSKQ